MYEVQVLVCLKVKCIHPLYPHSSALLWERPPMYWLTNRYWPMYEHAWGHFTAVSRQSGFSGLSSRGDGPEVRSMEYIPVIASSLLAFVLYINTLNADFAYDDRWVTLFRFWSLWQRRVRSIPLMLLSSIQDLRTDIFGTVERSPVNSETFSPRHGAPIRGNVTALWPGSGSRNLHYLLGGHK